MGWLALGIYLIGMLVTAGCGAIADSDGETNGDALVWLSPFWPILAFILLLYLPSAIVYAVVAKILRSYF